MDTVLSLDFMQNQNCVVHGLNVVYIKVVQGETARGIFMDGKKLTPCWRKVLKLAMEEPVKYLIIFHNFSI